MRTKKIYEVHRITPDREFIGMFLTRHEAKKVFRRYKKNTEDNEYTIIKKVLHDPLLTKVNSRQYEIRAARTT